MPIFICSLAILLGSSFQVQSTTVPSSVAITNSTQKSETANAGRIKGVVTYYFNDNFGDKGDVGSVVFLVSGTTELPPQNSEIVLSKGSVTISYRLSRDEEKQNKDAVKHKLPLPHLPRVVSIPVVDNTSIDVNGVFQFDDVPPGNYTVIIRSSHTREDAYFSNRDRNGRLGLVEIAVKSGRAVDASYKFPATGVVGAP